MDALQTLLRDAVWRSEQNQWNQDQLNRLHQTLYDHRRMCHDAQNDGDADDGDGDTINGAACSPRR